MLSLGDHAHSPIYEDTYTFTFCGIQFMLHCKIDRFGVIYFPSARFGDQVVDGRMLRETTNFHELNFAAPPAWLLHHIGPEYSVYDEPRRRGQHKSDGELVVFLFWEGVIEPIQAWAKEHRFLGRERTVLRSWKTARGTIEVCVYPMHFQPYLEIARWDSESHTSKTPERIAGDKDQLLHLAAAIAMVAGARERKVSRAVKKGFASGLSAVRDNSLRGAAPAKGDWNE